MRDMHDAVLPPSIALAVRIAPSRRVRAWLACGAMLHGASALVLLTKPAQFAWPALLGGACGAGAALAAWAACQRLNVRQIDISKTGVIRLTVQQKLPDHGRAVRLLPGSLLWRRLLVLRLGSVDDPLAPVQTLLVLPDSTDRASFRALAVAMHAIASRGSASDVQKIL